MNLRDSFIKILEEWPVETKKPFTNNQLASFIRSDFVQIVKKTASSKFTHFKFKASAGAGNWANIPWLSIIDERITSSTQDGIYPVFLFRGDGSGVYLSLNQGTTKPKHELGRQKAQKKAHDTIIRVLESIPQLTTWEKGPLDLRSNTSLGKSYESPNIASKFYAKTNFPDQDIIENDLLEILKIYNEIAERWSEVKSDISKPINNNQPNNFKLDLFQQFLSNANLILPPTVPIRFLAALLTKPFVILTGLAGSGKTKVAEALSLWLSENERQYCMVSVGADWTNRDPLLGYPNALEQGKYVQPDNGVLDLILEAIKIENKNRPYFLILDEMNMSHVERYFADFLSAMESVDHTIALHPDTAPWKDSRVPATVKLPQNLFIIGTVNIDETTYMFSPKVLDRASVIEFRVTENEMINFFKSPKDLDFDKLRGGGAAMAEDFVAKAKAPKQIPDNLTEYFMPFFIKLQRAGAEFGYRSAVEISRFVAACEEIFFEQHDAEGNSSQILMDRNAIVDAAIMQKLLPKVHGSRNKIENILKDLAKLCLDDGTQEPFTTGQDGIKYPLSYEKLQRMYTRVINDGFTSYAEA